MASDGSGVVEGDDGVSRCWWCVSDPLLLRYHDDEWGRPVDDDRRLFEKLTLEGFQSGLSWLTILRKRENFRKAFKSFDIATVARFNEGHVERLLGDAGIVRNRAKIDATINNAQKCLSMIKEFGGFASYIWSYEPQEPGDRPFDRAMLMQNTTSDESKAMSKDLKKRGWSFVGPTTVYAFMEAMGLVNDHLAGCHFYEEVEKARSRFRRPK